MSNELIERAGRIRLYAQDMLDTGFLSAAMVGNAMSIRDEADAVAALSAQPSGGVKGLEDARDFIIGLGQAPEAEGWPRDQYAVMAQIETALASLRAASPHLPAKPAVQEGIECHGLDTPERVCFYEQDFYVLSNFSAFNVTWAERRKFQTAEHCYHWLKFATLKGSPGNWTLSDESAAIAKSIAEAPSAHEAFKIAERNRRLRRPDWDDVKVEFMRKIIRAKAAQHEYVRRKLLATGDRELVENSWRDDFWGWGPNRDGKNMLGKLWMEVRAEIRAASPAPPEPASPSDEVQP